MVYKGENKMIKKVINNFMIWLNTPHCIDIPWFGESPDAELYEDLRKQQKYLETNESNLIKKALDHVYSTSLIRNGYLPSEAQAIKEAQAIYLDAKERGLINDFNELVKPKENY